MTIDEKVIPWLIAGFMAFLALLNYLRTRKKDEKQDAGADANMRLDVDYIKRGVDTIQIDLRQMRDNVGDLSVRMARVEEGCKSAHHRIDGLEKSKGE